jgi:transcription termination/antitermination protein NusA
MKNEIVEAFSLLAKEKNIDKEILSRILQEIFLNMLRKKYGPNGNYSIFVNMEKGEIEIYQSKLIVEQVTNDVSEIDLDSARRAEPDLELGDEFLEIIDPSSFGRRLIVSAKQNLNQRIKEIEKEIIFEEFKNRIGEIIIGDIRQVNRDEIFINVDRTELSLPKSEQIKEEKYRRGDSVRAVIKDVRWSSRGPEIIVSRSDPMFIMRLFELEIPEIYEGIIEIKNIAREPGERTKIAVYSHDKRIDAVGACVGMKGMRIQSIVKELNNEKVDIINYSSEPEIFITRALSPAKPTRILIYEDEKRVMAVLDDEQISLAIGKGGQNRRLACKLTQYDIQTVREEDYQKMVAQERESNKHLEDVEDLSEKLKKLLTEAGYQTIRDVLEASDDDLLQIPGIGEKTLEKIKNILHSHNQ